MKKGFGTITEVSEAQAAYDMALAEGDSVTIKCSKVRKNDKVYVLEKRV